MNKVEKKELATEIGEKLLKAKVAVFADYKGLSATQADALRKRVRDGKGEVKVLKNNLARLVVKDAKFGTEVKSVMDGLVGPTVVAFAYEDAAAVAKIVHKFSQDNEAFVIKESLLLDKKISAAEVVALASLPSREVLLSTLLGTMNAPIASFARVLAAVPRGLVTVLAAIEKKKSENN